jgi:hypothetical protein
MTNELPEDTKCKHCDTGCKFCDARFMWQTPYAWFHYKDFTLIYHDVWEELIEGTDDWVPLYLEQQRTWVGLTDDDLIECERLADIRHRKHMGSIRGQQLSSADQFLWHYARAIESKLKEKNI